ncbi:MAG: hypothetical protein PHC71_00155 [Candidatus Omnitrophica bacterium]|nr:hypothetical protein [Candidatus Omnitrophota bacterium]
MSNLKKMQDLALKLILFLVWFDFMCFTIIITANILNWSFFNSKIASAFFTVFGISLGSLAALCALHIVLTLSIISKSISTLVNEKEPVDETAIKKDKNNFRNLILTSVAIILLVVGYQGMVERNVARSKVKGVENQVKNMAQSVLVSKLVDLVQNDDKVNKLYFLRDEILLSSEEYRSLSLLIPRSGEQGQVFYEITPWDYDNKDETNISKALKRVFVPCEEDRKKFNRMLKNQEPFIVVTSYAIKAYYPVVRDGKIKLIILLDTSRNISSEYLMSRSSKIGS